MNKGAIKHPSENQCFACLEGYERSMRGLGILSFPSLAKANTFLTQDCGIAFLTGPYSRLL